jgi:hypothetical protein
MQLGVLLLQLGELHRQGLQQLPRTAVRVEVVLGQLARDLVAALGRDQQDRPLERRQAAQHQVQQDERVLVEPGDGLVGEHPDAEEDQGAEDEDPRPHAVAHSVGGTLAERETLAAAHPRVLTPAVQAAEMVFRLWGRFRLRGLGGGVFLGGCHEKAGCGLAGRRATHLTKS